MCATSVWGTTGTFISGVDYLDRARHSRPRSPRRRDGWSQGGYISAFITCSSDRFKAVSVGAGTFRDWMTYYVNTEFTRHATVSEGDALGDGEDLPEDFGPSLT